MSHSVGSISEPGEDAEEMAGEQEVVEDKKSSKKKKSKKDEAAEREILSQGEGSWLSHLKLDEEVVWRI